jgi:hypothetical protein
MGYALNEIANLPVDDDVHFYIFVVNGNYREPLYDIIQQNFMAIAKSIGSNAVIAVGTDPRAFTTQVAQQYLGQGNTDGSFLRALPALLITNAHPSKLTKDSMRLIVPLRDAESRFGGWQQFFDLLSSFVKGESSGFLEKFEKKENLLDAANKIVNLKPGMFGISLNINELYDRWRKKHA